MDKNNISFQKLAFKQTRTSVLVAFLLGIFISTFQIGIDFFQVQTKASDTVSQTLQVIEQSFAQAVNDNNLKLLKDLTVGLFRYEPIYKISIYKGNKLILQDDEGLIQDDFRWISDLIFGQSRTYSIDMNHITGKNILQLFFNKSPQQSSNSQRSGFLGRVEVSIDTFSFGFDFVQRAGSIVGFGLLRNIILSLVLLYFFSNQLTKPFIKVISAFDKIDPENPARYRLKTPKGHEVDEFNTLVEDTNQMLQSIEQKRGELFEKHEILLNVINHLPDIIFVKDREGQFQLVNQTFEEISQQKGKVDCQPNKMIGKTDFDFYPEQLAQQFKKDDLAVSNGEKILNKEEQIPIDGKEQWFSTTKVPWRNESGDIRGVIGLSRDITHLKNQNMILEEKVETRTKELEKTTEQLFQSEKMASLAQLIAGVAHEVNTPLGIILIGATHLESTIRDWRNSGDGTPHDQQRIERLKKAAHYIVSNVHSAIEILDNFKKVAIDHTSEERQIFSITRLIDNIWNNLKYRYSNYNTSIQITPESSLEINSFPSTFSQIFTNLFVNIFTHAYSSKEKVDIRITLEEKEDQLIIHFTDKGKGIPEKHLKKIFDPFFTTQRARGRTGLGLNIVYNFVTQSLNGKIECSSQEGEGTTFLIKTPLK